MTSDQELADNACISILFDQVNYARAGRTELVVSSYKTIFSKNGKGAIKGKGLRIKNAHNVIIQDISITDINPEVIWGGDALAFDNVYDVWIHRVYFAVGLKFRLCPFLARLVVNGRRACEHNRFV